MGINHGFTASNSQHFVTALLGWLLIRLPKIVASSLDHTGKHIDTEKRGSLPKSHHHGWKGPEYRFLQFMTISRRGGSLLARARMLST